MIVSQMNNAMVNLASTVGGVLGSIAVGATGDRTSLERGLNASAAILLVGLTPFVITSLHASRRVTPPVARPE